MFPSEFLPVSIVLRNFWNFMKKSIVHSRDVCSKTRGAGPSTSSLAHRNILCYVEKDESHIHDSPHYLHLCEHAYMLTGMQVSYVHLERPNTDCKLVLAHIQAWAEMHTVRVRLQSVVFAPGEELVLLCSRNLPAFRPLSWCTLELCLHPICTPRSSLCTTLQPSPQVLPGNSLTARLIGIYRNASFTLTCRLTNAYKSHEAQTLRYTWWTTERKVV